MGCQNLYFWKHPLNPLLLPLSSLLHYYFSLFVWGQLKAWETYDARRYTSLKGSWISSRSTLLSCNDNMPSYFQANLCLIYHWTKKKKNTESLTNHKSVISWYWNKCQDKLYRKVITKAPTSFVVESHDCVSQVASTDQKFTPRPN